MPAWVTKPWVGAGHGYYALTVDVGDKQDRRRVSTKHLAPIMIGLGWVGLGLGWRWVGVGWDRIVWS